MCSACVGKAWSKFVRQVGPLHTIHTSTSPCNAHQSSQALMHSNAHDGPALRPPGTTEQELPVPEAVDAPRPTGDDGAYRHIDVLAY